MVSLMSRKMAVQISFHWYITCQRYARNHRLL